MHQKLWNKLRKSGKPRLKNAKIRRIKRWRKEAIDSSQRWSKSYSRKRACRKSLSKGKGAPSITTKSKEMRLRREKIDLCN